MCAAQRDNFLPAARADYQQFRMFLLIQQRCQQRIHQVILQLIARDFAADIT
ncbi:hypothetical protein D3C75_881360 [compost metagenome]